MRILFRDKVNARYVLLWSIIAVFASLRWVWLIARVVCLVITFIRKPRLVENALITVRSAMIMSAFCAVKDFSMNLLKTDASNVRSKTAINA